MISTLGQKHGGVLKVPLQLTSPLQGTSTFHAESHWTKHPQFLVQSRKLNCHLHREAVLHKNFSHFPIFLSKHDHVNVWLMKLSFSFTKALLHIEQSNSAFPAAAIASLALPFYLVWQKFKKAQVMLQYVLKFNGKAGTHSSFANSCNLTSRTVLHPRLKTFVISISC